MRVGLVESTLVGFSLWGGGGGNRVKCKLAMLPPRSYVISKCIMTTFFFFRP